MKHVFWRALVLALAFLAGCAAQDPLPNAPTSGTTAPALTEPAPTEPAPTEPPTTQPPEPVQVDTSSGVVIVGTVGKDDQGWYLTPEQPLDVTFRFFDEPSVFEGVTRVHLFDPQEDGVEKSVYLGMTVTVEGAFSFYRDYFDRLYLAPYRITLGKTVEGSYADPQLQPPEIHESKYDPSIPLPPEMELTVRQGQYVYNPYILFPETLELMGNDFAPFFVTLVDALLARQETLACPRADYAQMLTTVTFYELPLYGALAEPFVYLYDYDPQQGTITIRYKLDPQAHEATVERFMEEANRFLAGTAPGQSQGQMAQSIYHALCTRMTYDYSALEDLSRKDTYYAYLEHTGVCVTFANAYNQLLAQVGMDGRLVSCEYDLTMGHAWSMVEVDGKWYFFDPTFELNEKDGQAYFYYGMNYHMRTQQGLGANGIYLGLYTSTLVEPHMISPDPLPVQ